MYISAGVRWAWRLFGIQRLSERIDGLVKISRGNIGAKGVDRSYRKNMCFTRSDKASDCAVGIGRLATVLLEGDTGIRKSLADIIDEHGTLLPVFNRPGCDHRTSSDALLRAIRRGWSQTGADNRLVLR